MRFKNRAACEGIDVEIFFSEKGGYYPHRNTVKKMCKTCLALEECFNYSIDNLVEGLWAGISKDERDKYRSKHGIIGKTVVPISVFNSNYDS